LLNLVLLASAGLVLVSIAGVTATRTTLHVARNRRLGLAERNSRVRDLRNKVELARLQSSLSSSEPADGQLPWRVLEVAEIVQESDDCRSYYLVDPYGGELPGFQPGQYLMLRPALAGSYQTTRCYSLSSAPDPRFWRVTVKREAAPDVVSSRSPRRQGGLSAWLHDTIQAGDYLMVGGPAGQFYLPEGNQQPLVLLAAGIGVTPMCSMLRWSLEHTPDRQVSLLFQAQDVDHWPLGSHLHQWQAFPAANVVSYFSRMEANEVAQIQGDHLGTLQPGRFTGQMATAMPRGNEADYFLCGPDAWMTAIRSQLVDSGIPAEQIHWESFGAAPSEQKTRANGEAQNNSSPACVRFAHSDIDAQWQGSQSLWELARENSVEIPSGCLNGVCGCCRVRLLQGSVSHEKPVALELGQNECLSCIAVPNGDVVVDA